MRCKLPGKIDQACRFLYVIQYYVASGFHVALSYHAGSNRIESDRQIVADCPTFQQNWLSLLIALQSLSSYEKCIKGIHQLSAAKAG